MFPQIWLSPTTLNMVKDCHRCMWEHILWKQKRPQGPFPTLPRGVDEAQKIYCDGYRGVLPPSLKALAAQEPTLMEFSLHKDLRWMNSLRDWKGGLTTTITFGSQKYRISGAVDDLLVRDSDGALAILDGKSKAKKPEAGEGLKYYGTQMDTYDLLIRKSGFDSAGVAYLWYLVPVSMEDRDILLPNPTVNLVFDQFVQKLEVSGDRSMALIEEVHKMVVDHTDRTKPPASGSSCEYCAWAGRS